jgi:AcrR family transcriptional regulator
VAQARAKTAERPLVRPAAEESTRRRILEAATREFLDKSYDGTSMGAIARRVGISPPALYWHFDSKSSLFYAFLDSVLTDFVTAVAAAVTVTDPRGRLRQFVRAHVVRQLSKAGTGAASGDSIRCWRRCRVRNAGGSSACSGSTSICCARSSAKATRAASSRSRTRPSRPSRS